MIKDAVTSQDYGVVFHLEYKFKDHYLSPGITARYLYGLADVIKDNEGDQVLNSVFEILLSFPIGGEKDVQEEPLCRSHPYAKAPRDRTTGGLFCCRA